MIESRSVKQQSQQLSFGWVTNKAFVNHCVIAVCASRPLILSISS